MTLEINVEAWFHKTQSQLDRLFSGHADEIRKLEAHNPLLAALAEITIHNAALWGHEDQVRRTDIEDSEIVRYKRLIDRENQLRNNSIDQTDRILRDQLGESSGSTNTSLPLNTETPGSAFDRLSIMALRIRSLTLELARKEASEEHKATCSQKKSEVEERVRDLSQSLQDLLTDIRQGRKRLKSYNMHKLYNDPATNPATRGR